MTEADYPYVAARETCAYDNAKATKLIVTSQGAPTSDNVLSMKSAVAVQPVSVGVDASGIRFFLYSRPTRVVSLMVHVELTSIMLPLLLDTALILKPTKNTGS